MKSMNPNDLGKTFLVEECQKLEINSFLRKVKGKLKETLLSSEFEVVGRDIGLANSETGCGGIRYWFKCPQCQRRVGTLFIHPISQQIGCRGCLGLEYRKRRYKGMAESY